MIGVGCAIRLTVALVLVTVADQREQCFYPRPSRAGPVRSNRSRTEEFLASPGQNFSVAKNSGDQQKISFARIDVAKRPLATLPTPKVFAVEGRRQAEVTEQQGKAGAGPGISAYTRAFRVRRHLRIAARIWDSGHRHGWRCLVRLTLILA